MFHWWPWHKPGTKKQQNPRGPRLAEARGSGSIWGDKSPSKEDKGRVRPGQLPAAPRPPRCPGRHRDLRSRRQQRSLPPPETARSRRRARWGGPQSCRHLPPLPPTARPQREGAAQPPSQPAAAITFPHPLAARPSPAHRGEAAQHGGSLTGRRYTDSTAASSPALGTARPAGAGGAEGGQRQGPSFGELQSAAVIVFLRLLWTDHDKHNCTEPLSSNAGPQHCKPRGGSRRGGRAGEQPLPGRKTTGRSSCLSHGCGAAGRIQQNKTAVFSSENLPGKGLTNSFSANFVYDLRFWASFRSSHFSSCFTTSVCLLVVIQRPLTLVKILHSGTLTPSANIIGMVSANELADPLRTGPPERSVKRTLPSKLGDALQTRQTAHKTCRNHFCYRRPAHPFAFLNKTHTL